MAFVDSSVDQTQNQNPNQTANPVTGLNPALNQAPQTASATSSNSTAGSGAQGAASTPTASTAAPVQNLSSYLTANAPQAQQLGQNIATSLNNQFGKVQGDINNASTQFNNQVQSSTTPFNSQLVSGALANPTQFVSDPNNVSQFQGQLNAKYSGPTDFTQMNGYGDINSEVQNAVTNAANAKSQQGLGNLVNSVETNPTPGQSTLDAMILGGNPDAWNTVQQAAAPFSSLTGYLGGQTTANNAAAQNALQNTTATANQAHQALTGAGTDFTTALNQKVQAAQKGLTDYGTNINNYVGQIQKGGLNGLTSFDQHVLGVDPTIAALARSAPGIENELQSGLANFPSLSVPNLQDAFTIPSVQPGISPTLQNVSSADDYAKAQALEQLAGGNILGLPLDAATASQAGTFNLPTALPTFDGKKGAQELYDSFLPSAGTGYFSNLQNPSNNAYGAEMDYQNLMNSLAAYLGQPAFSTNPALPPTTTPTPPPAGGPANGPPGGDVHH